MDRNAITGIILITLILGIFWWISTPSKEEQDRYLRQQDSLRQVEIAQKAEMEALKLKEAEQQNQPVDTIQQALELNNKFGIFAASAEGKDELITIENKLMKVVLSTRGGKIYSVELKDYKTFDQKPLVLFNGDQNKFGFQFTYNNRFFETNELYFQVVERSSNSAEFRLMAGEGSNLSFKYHLPEDSYMMDFSVIPVNMEHVFPKNQSSLELVWHMTMPKQEKGRDFEVRNSGIYYKYDQSEVDWMTPGETDEEDLRIAVKWVAFKDQFFSSVLVSNKPFYSAKIKSTVPQDKESQIIRHNEAQLTVPFNVTHVEGSQFSFYFGPNHFYTLKSYNDKELELKKLIQLGWGFLGWINRIAVIPVFNFFEQYIGNYGLIILILTLLIKLVLFPLTYKSYISTAKMKVLKPQIDEINERIPKDKAMERQTAVMALYKKAGVNPLGGCLPMLLQFPILIAMFNFFPASIELRQEPFLWAEDLSAYDAIVSWSTQIPLLSQFYGNHISLFCLLMAITNIVYTWMNQEMTASTQTMPGMKTMMYLMPVMFLFFFNNYSSGLSYYYFISTLITIVQTILIRRFVDEKALLAKLQANQKKPVQKSKFQQRLEDMAKQQQQLRSGKKR